MRWCRSRDSNPDEVALNGLRVRPRASGSVRQGSLSCARPFYWGSCAGRPTGSVRPYCYRPLLPKTSPRPRWSLAGRRGRRLQRHGEGLHVAARVAVDGPPDWSTSSRCCQGGRSEKGPPPRRLIRAAGSPCSGRARRRSFRCSPVPPPALRDLHALSHIGERLVQLVEVEAAGVRPGLTKVRDGVGNHAY